MLFIILIGWGMLIFYFSSQPSKISYGQSGRAVKIIEKLNDLFDITDMKLYKSAELFFRDILLRGRYKTPNALVRKSAHFGIYLIMGMICSSFGYIYSKKILIALLLGTSLPVTIAVLDEFNQKFVGRTSSLDDVILDGVGAFTGTMVFVCILLLLKAARQLYKRFQRNF